MNKSKLVIAHDGGILHSAWITGSKSIALFPAKNEKFIPLRNCKNFISDSDEYMNSIKLNEVKNYIKGLLK